MITQRKHYVTFQSPGTFFNEATTQPIDSWDVKKAVEMSGLITERYNATPYAFRFTTRITHPPIDDGEGGTLEVSPKEVKESCRYFLGGRVETLQEVKDRGDGKDKTLLSNMECNEWNTIIRGAGKSYNMCQPFVKDDVCVGPDGEITHRASEYK